MKTVIDPQREIPVIAEADVIVVGGGPAGIGAALASVRNGAKTILMERFGCLGGMQTQCLNPTFSLVDPEIQARATLRRGEKSIQHVARYEGLRYDRGGRPHR